MACGRTRVRIRQRWGEAPERKDGGKGFGEAKGRERRGRKDGRRAALGRGENGWGRGRVSLTSHYIPETDPRAFIRPSRVNAAGPEAEE